MDQVISDFIYPAIVAVLATFGGYLATYVLNKNQRDTENKIRKSDFLSNIQNEFTQISAVLERLKDDIGDNSYFSIKTILTANPSYLRLKQLRDDITLIINKEERSQINDAIGFVITLLEDIDSLERYLLDESNKHNLKKAELRKELRSIQVKLLDRDFYLDKENQIKSFKGKNTQLEPSEKEAVEKILENLVSELQESEQALNQNYKDAERKRLVLTTRIVDVQAQVRDTQNLINRLISTERI